MDDRSTGLGGARTDSHRDGADDTVADVEDERMLLLRLRLRPGEPLSGSVGLAEETAALAFRGWIDFMAAVNRLRRENAVPPGRQR